MGIRETLNKNQKTITMITAGVIVVFVGLIIWQLLPDSGPSTPTKAYFSDDDGKTFFVDDINKIAPFKHSSGREAVRAHVFKCPSGGDPYVGYLEKYHEGAKRVLEQWQNDPASKGGPMPRRYEIDEQGKFFKKPGQDPRAWVSWQVNAQVAAKVQEVMCPDGKTYADEVTPD